LRDNQFGDLKVPLTWTAGVAVVVAGVVAAALLLTDRRERFQSEAYGVTRQVTDAVAAPVGGVLSAPGRWVGLGGKAVGEYFFAVSENRRLKAELAEMRQWRDVAIALRDTNDRYKTILGLKTDPPIPMTTARVVTDARGPFAHTRLANAGVERGVREGNPVMSENGIVGRVIGVTNGASRILMLTDIASRVPVMVDRTNARAILTGDGGPNPKLEYLRGKDPVKEGDRILTSGDGGLMPRGLPVGVAVKGLDGAWRVVLASDAAPIDFVRILLFQDFAQLANAAELNRMTPPPPVTPPEPATGAATPPPASASPAPGAAAPRPAAPAATPPARPATSPPAAAPATPRPATPRPSATAPATPRPAAAAPTPPPATATPAPAESDPEP
jgi:rod shape-determining protein MreC